MFRSMLEAACCGVAEAVSAAFYYHWWLQTYDSQPGPMRVGRHQAYVYVIAPLASLR